MRRVARYIYVGAAWLALAGVLIAILLAGFALFVNRPYWQTHIDVGWGSELPLLLLILAGIAGWIPRRLAGWLVAVIVLHVVQTALPALKENLPLIAALHPLNASLLGWLSLAHARKAQELLLGSASESSESSPSLNPAESPGQETAEAIPADVN